MKLHLTAAGRSSGGLHRRNGTTSTTRRHTAALMATAVGGILALGACGEQAPPDDAAPSVPREQATREQATREQATAAAAELSADVREARSRFTTPGFAETVTANKLHTGIPRVTRTDLKHAADLGWPTSTQAPAGNLTDGYPNRAE